MLYKLGLTYKRQEYFKQDMLDTMSQKQEEHKSQTQLYLSETSEFIRGFHLEFEQYLTRQKKER